MSTPIAPGPRSLIETAFSSGGIARSRCKSCLQPAPAAFRNLEREFGRDLQRPRATAAEERVPDANVACGGHTESTDRPSVSVNAIRRSISDERWQVWICEVRMI